MQSIASGGIQPQASWTSRSTCSSSKGSWRWRAIAVAAASAGAGAWSTGDGIAWFLSGPAARRAHGHNPTLRRGRRAFLTPI